MNGIVLEARNLSKSYRGEVPVLAGCDFAARSGEVVALVGASGVGKTTLLQILAGILVPDDGTVHCSGRRMAGPSQDVAVVFQDYGLLPWRTAARNVAFPLEVARVERRERQDRAVQALTELGLGESLSKFPHQLSGGMQQRLAIARALVSRPSVLLLDEPFSALDVGSKRSLISRLDRLRREQELTVVVVTHDLGDAAEMADRVVLLGERPAKVVAEKDIDNGESVDDLRRTLEAMVLGPHMKGETLTHHDPLAGREMRTG